MNIATDANLAIGSRDTITDIILYPGERVFPDSAVKSRVPTMLQHPLLVAVVRFRPLHGKDV